MCRCTGVHKMPSCVCCKRLKFGDDAIVVDLQSRRQDDAFRLMSEV